MGLVQGKMVMKEFLWDFDIDGGGTGAITLPGVDKNDDLLEEGFIIMDFGIFVETAVTTGGSPTITFGTTADVDGYMATVAALVTSDNDVVNAGSVAGALLWDDTNDHPIWTRVTSNANTQDILMTIGTAALTAGKIRAYVMGFKPTSRERVA